MSRKKYNKVEINTAKNTFESLVSAEVTLQLRELKTQLNKEMAEDLKVMHRQLIDTITYTILQQLNTIIDNKIKESLQVDKPPTDLALVTKNELTTNLNQQIQQVYTTINSNMVNEINEKVIPRINNIVKWVQYNTQDGGEVIDNYRREVERQTSGTKYITDGRNDGKVISPYVRTFFGEKD